MPSCCLEEGDQSLFSDALICLQRSSMDQGNNDYNKGARHRQNRPEETKGSEIKYYLHEVAEMIATVNLIRVLDIKQQNGKHFY